MRSRAESSPSHVYAPELGDVGSALELSREESHYLARVCRGRPGDRATVTDGRGAIATVRIESVAGSVRVEIESLERVERSRRAWLWCGAPEGERADWMVEKLAELGVDVLQAVSFERGDWGSRPARIARMRRLAIAALRQSRRAHLMEIRDPLEPERALSGIPGDSARYVGRMDGAVPDRAGDGLWVGVIGPAAGMTPAEEKFLEAGGFQGIRLSDGRLRTETAALALAAWWSRG